MANTQTDSTKTDKFTYYFVGIDTGKNGVENYIEENNLNRSSVKAGNATETNIAAVGSGTLQLSGKTYTLDAICEEE